MEQGGLFGLIVHISLIIYIYPNFNLDLCPDTGLKKRNKKKRFTKKEPKKTVNFQKLFQEWQWPRWKCQGGKWSIKCQGGKWSINDEEPNGKRTPI